jgi:putative ABC transport system permease protein
MKRLGILTERLRALFRRDAVIEEINEEMRFHVEMETQTNIERGMRPEEARAAALKSFGNPGRMKDLAYEIRGGRIMDRFWQDLRYSLRRLLKNPTFTCAAVLVIALGIGPNTAMFSAIYGVFWAGWAESSRMVVLWAKPRDNSIEWHGDSDGMDRTRIHISPREYEEWQRRCQSFDALSAVVQRQVTLNDEAQEPEQIVIKFVTPGLFTMNGERMILGRDFAPEDGIKGNHHVVILSNRLWQTRYGGDPQILGKSIRLDGESYTVVGVAAPGAGQEPLWPVLVVKADESRMDNRMLTVIARLKPGVSLRQAQAEIDAVSAALAQEYPKSNAGWSVSVERSRNNWLPRRTFQNLWLLMGAVTLVLLIACANVANLLLARGAAHQKEVAVRAALGATRWTLFGQLLTESLVLCLAGGALGIALSWAILKAFLALMPSYSGLPTSQIGLSLPVLLFTALTTLISGLIFGCVPAWRATRVNLVDDLKEGGGAGRGRAHHRLARMLVVAEFAVALTLLAAAGMALRSLWNNTRLDHGVRTDHILTFGVPVRPDRFKSPGEMLAFYQELIGKIETLPDVRRVSISTPPPVPVPSIEMWTLRFSIPGRPSADPSRPLYEARGRMISDGFVETFGARVIQGRAITAQDHLKSEPVVMVNETFAREYLAGLDPLTQVLLFSGGTAKFRIIGVFRDIHNAEEFGHRNAPEIYGSFSQFPFPNPTLAVWALTEPAQLRRSISALVRSMDRGLPVANVRTLEEIISSQLAFGRFEAVIYSSFAGLALLLAAVGIYGVMSLLVKQRTREMGLRIALGASRSQVVRLVIKQGLALATAGLILGAGCAWSVARLMQSTLYGAGSPYLATLAVVGAVLLCAALVACLIPALRAARVQPMVALRND